MTASAISDTELVTEHFGYPPVSLIDDIINSVNILAERALNSVEQGLLNAPPSSLGFKSSSKSKSKSQRQKKDNDDADDGAQPAPEEQARAEIEAGTHQLETLLCASIDRNFDKFEIYVLRNVLCVKPADVRDWMRLSHYEGLDFSSAVSGSKGDNSNGNGDRMDVDAGAGAAGDVPTLDSVNLLRRKLRESMRLNAVLTAECARNDKMLEELRALVGAGALAANKIKSESSSPAGKNSNSNSNSNNKGASTSQGNAEAVAVAANEAAANNKDPPSSASPFAFLHRKGDLTGAGGATPLSTTTAFTLSQMQALRALSTSLRNVTPDLVDKQVKQEDDDGGDDNASNSSPDGKEGEAGRKNNKDKNKSWRRERLEYVEGATRRHLETVQGLELGRHGEVRDGEWQGGGRNLARGEVEGLERLVGLLEEKGGGGGGNSFPTTTTTTTTAAAKTARRTTGTATATATPAKSKSTKKEASGDDDDDADDDGDRMDES
ncbi:Mis12 protein-domain-containing protein [Biscogniauxia marginata]|nr:Mis12 protein-domain-containing protein [Biscogniauxia marginata]